jgi:hypothetical protein
MLCPLVSRETSAVLPTETKNCGKLGEILKIQKNNFSFEAAVTPKHFLTPLLLKT